MNMVSVEFPSRVKCQIGKEKEEEEDGELVREEEKAPKVDRIATCPDEIISRSLRAQCRKLISDAPLA